MRIQHNIMAMNAYRNYSNNTSALSKNLEKLSSGYKINRAGDDAAGLAISEKMRAQITGLDVAQKNAKDGISLVQTAEGALTEVHDMLNRMVELASQSANGTYDNDVDRANLQKEMDQLLEEIDRIADSSNFNGINLLDGTLGLNEDAFDIANVDAAQASVVADAIQAGMPAAGDIKGTDTILHKAGTDAVAGSFTVDLSQLSIKADGADAAEIEIEIAGETFTITADDADTDLDAKTIAAKLVTALGDTSGKAGTILVGAADATGLEYVAKNNGDGTVTFTATNDGAGTALTGGVPSDQTSDAALAVINATVTATKTAGANELTGAENISTTNITNSAKATTATFGNTFLTLDMSKIEDGMVLEIAGEQYTFAVGDDSAVDTTQGNVIDLTQFDLTTTDAAEQANIMAAITRATSNNATLTVGNDGTYGQLSFAEKTDGAGNSEASAEMQEKMSTLEGFQSLVTVNKPAANKGTAVTIDAAQLVNGDVISVGDDHRFVFTTDPASVSADEIAVEIDGANTITNFQDALESAGFDVAVDGDKVTIYAANATDAAPIVLGGGLTLQIGDTSDDFNQLDVLVQDMHVDSLGIQSLSIANQVDAAAAVDKIKAAINTVSSVRGTLGATQNRLDHTINNLSVMEENIQDAESTIRDTDVAEEMMEYTKNNILIQSAQAMLAQANQVPQGVLQLLQ